MNILIIGSGGREVAIAKKLYKDKSKCYLFYYGTSKNPSMDMYCKYCGHVDNFNDFKKILKVITDNIIRLCFIGPEGPLKIGLVDYLESNNIKCFGPKSACSQIETSKAFARELMKEYDLNIYSPKFKVFDKISDEMYKYVKNLYDKGGVVIKADGLHGGKGVKVSGDHFNKLSSAYGYCENIIKSNEMVVIEEKLIGEEFSLMSFSDGDNLRHMIPVKDYKRALPYDKGENTGSMGSLTGFNGELWFLDNDDIELCQTINEKIVDAIYKKTSIKYKGVIYGSFMKTETGIKVIEFNARFGDPECINVLHLLETSLLKIFLDVILYGLDNTVIRFSPNATVFKYKAPKEYPNKKVSFKLESDYNLDELYLASITKDKSNNYVCLGSRTYGVLVEDSSSLFYASNKANEILDKYNDNDKLVYRWDIGQELSIVLNENIVSECDNYKRSGVNVDENENVVNSIEKSVMSTYKNRVLNKFGDFGGIIKHGNNKYISSTDGVGTKSLFILELFGYDRGFEMLGADIVNHCVNDILVKGAVPLFFMDYFAGSKIDSNHVQKFIEGAAYTCNRNNCVLLGGETAEMPDIYKDNAFDIVGTIVGTINNNKLINGKNDVQVGNIVIGLTSTGPHTNGYSLIRNMMYVYKKMHIKCTKKDIVRTFGNFCYSHRSYLNDIKILWNNDIKINGMCHITGGGFVDNPKRILPNNMKIQWMGVKYTNVFIELKELHNSIFNKKIDDAEMLRVFNCGTGMILILDESYLSKLREIELEFKLIGKVIEK